MVDTQVKSGRYKDFSAAVQGALWNFFVGPQSPFDEYQVTADEVDRSAKRELAGIKKDRKRGRLKPWNTAVFCGFLLRLSVHFHGFTLALFPLLFQVLLFFLVPRLFTFFRFLLRVA